jgi:hypothetical protein
MLLPAGQQVVQQPSQQVGDKLSSTAACRKCATLDVVPRLSHLKVEGYEPVHFPRDFFTVADSLMQRSMLVLHVLQGNSAVWSQLQHLCERHPAGLAALYRHAQQRIAAQEQQLREQEQQLQHARQQLAQLSQHGSSMHLHK